MGELSSNPNRARVGVVLLVYIRIDGCDVEGSVTPIEEEIIEHLGHNVLAPALNQSGMLVTNTLRAPQGAKTRQGS